MFMVEALTVEERDAFIEEAKRLGKQRVVILLTRRNVSRFSELCRADRIAFMGEMRRTQGLKR